jgi:CRISPR-associated exonuclease Cas4
MPGFMPGSTVPLAAAALLAVLALVLLWVAARHRRLSGLPSGRVVYADPRTWGPVEKPFYDPQSHLSGKPDYLVRQERGLAAEPYLIPVEVKTGRVPAYPPDSHIFQLAAYCLLVERSTGVRPPYGILHYTQGSRSFAVDYTPALEEALLDLVDEIRAQERRPEVDRSHDSPTRCTGCGFRGICDQRL